MKSMAGESPVAEEVIVQGNGICLCLSLVTTLGLISESYYQPSDILCIPRVCSILHSALDARAGTTEALEAKATRFGQNGMFIRLSALLIGTSIWFLIGTMDRFSFRSAHCQDRYEPKYIPLCCSQF
jgi:hypothetical protein